MFNYNDLLTLYMKLLIKKGKLGKKFHMNICVRMFRISRGYSIYLSATEFHFEIIIFTNWSFDEKKVWNSRDIWYMTIFFDKNVYFPHNIYVFHSKNSKIHKKVCRLFKARNIRSLSIYSREIWYDEWSFFFPLLNVNSNFDIKSTFSHS